MVETDTIHRRCSKARLLGIALVLFSLIAVCGVVELVNPQAKYVYLIRYLPYTSTLAPIDVPDARKRLSKGMTKAQVLSTLGRPVGANGDPWRSRSDALFKSDGWAIWCYNWQSTTEYFYVEFDNSGGVDSFGEK